MREDDEKMIKSVSFLLHFCTTLVTFVVLWKSVVDSGFSFSMVAHEGPSYTHGNTHYSVCFDGNNSNLHSITCLTKLICQTGSIVTQDISVVSLVSRRIRSRRPVLTGVGICLRMIWNCYHENSQNTVYNLNFLSLFPV